MNKNNGKRVFKKKKKNKIFSFLSRKSFFFTSTFHVKLLWFASMIRSAKQRKKISSKINIFRSHCPTEAGREISFLFSCPQKTTNNKSKNHNTRERWKILECNFRNLRQPGLRDRGQSPKFLFNFSTDHGMLNFLEDSKLQIPCCPKPLLS